MEPLDKYKGKLIVISGPSGVGKSTIVKQVCQRTGIALSVSATTRAKSEKETDGVDYWFLTEDDFQKKLNNDEFLEYAKVFDNWYGTPKDKVDEILDQDKPVILEIDTQGGLSVRSIYEEDAVMIFILPPSNSELKKRINGRARETDDEQLKKRIANASNEIAMAWQHYEHMVINDVLETAVNEIITIIKNEVGESK
jgi:guanylate kinase